MKDVDLRKRLWTGDDFDTMEWHDCYIYATAFGTNYQFALDIDYILQWVEGPPHNNDFKFWVSPSTLIFENVYDLGLSIEITEPFVLQIDHITRNNPQRPRNSEYIKGETEYNWTVETQQGQINFKSIGYIQFLRADPRLLETQSIGLEQRGGISFHGFPPGARPGPLCNLLML